MALGERPSSRWVNKYSRLPRPGPNRRYTHESLAKTKTQQAFERVKPIYGLRGSVGM
jgi:hypothetical protein